jgi:hypothetical protein
MNRRDKKSKEQDKLLIKALKTDRGKQALAKAMLTPIRTNFVHRPSTPEEVRKSCKFALDVVTKRLKNEKICQR